MTVTPVQANVKGAAKNEHPRVKQFHAQATAIMEQAPDGPAAVARISQMFGAYQAADWNREHALLDDLRRTSSDAGISRAMMASVIRSAAREVERSGRLSGRVQHLRDVEAALTGLAGQLAGQHPEIAEQIRGCLISDEDQAPPAAHGFATLGLMVDARYSVGEFNLDGKDAGAIVRFPFVGWVVCVDTHDDVDAFRSYEACYSVRGEVWPLSQLRRAGYHWRCDLT